MEERIMNELNNLRDFLIARSTLPNKTINKISWNMHIDCKVKDALQLHVYDDDEESTLVPTPLEQFTKMNHFDNKSKIVIPSWLLFNTEGPTIGNIVLFPAWKAFD
jgi:hypothetical protein